MDHTIIQFVQCFTVINYCSFLLLQKKLFFPICSYTSAFSIIGMIGALYDTCMSLGGAFLFVPTVLSVDDVAAVILLKASLHIGHVFVTLLQL